MYLSLTHRFHSVEGSFHSVSRIVSIAQCASAALPTVISIVATVVVDLRCWLFPRFVWCIKRLCGSVRFFCTCVATASAALCCDRHSSCGRHAFNRLALCFFLIFAICSSSMAVSKASRSGTQVGCTIAPQCSARLLHYSGGLVHCAFAALRRF